MKHIAKIFCCLILITIISSCKVLQNNSKKNVLIKEYQGGEFTIDTEGYYYKPIQIITTELNNYEISATIEFNNSYRSNSSAWAGFFIKSDSINGEHGKASGYLCFVREDGEIGIHTSPPPNREIKTDTYKYPIKSRKRDVRIKCKDSMIKFYVDNKLVYKIEDFKLNGKYVSANGGGGVSTFKIDYIKVLK